VDGPSPEYDEFKLVLEALMTAQLREPSWSKTLLPDHLKQLQAQCLPPEERQRFCAMQEDREELLGRYVILPKAVLGRLQQHCSDLIVGLAEAAVSEMEQGNALYAHRAGPRTKADRRRDRLEEIRKGVVELRMTDEQLLEHLRQHEEGALLRKGAGRVKGNRTIVPNISYRKPILQFARCGPGLK
jgi:hypothetical protein